MYSIYFFAIERNSVHVKWDLAGSKGTLKHPSSYLRMDTLLSLLKLSERSFVFGKQMKKIESTHKPYNRPGALTWRRYSTAMPPNVGFDEPCPAAFVRIESTTNEHSAASVRHSITAIYLQWLLRVSFVCGTCQTCF